MTLGTLRSDLAGGAARRQASRLADAVVLFVVARVAWLKKASKVPTDMTEAVIREAALPRGRVNEARR